MKASRHGVGLSLVIVALALGALACDISTNAAATALAPTAIPAPGTPISGGGAIRPGERLASAIQQQGEEHFYTFHGEAGQAVTIDMEAGPGGGLDSYLELRDPTGTSLLTNDDGGNGLNSRIFNFVLPESGEYTIVTYGFSHYSTGTYSLTMDLGTPMPTPTVTPTPFPSPTVEPGGGAITLGQTVSGELRIPGQDDLWTFEARAGDIVTITMNATTPGLDSYLELAGPNGQVLLVDDDSGGNLNSRLANVVLPVDGTYTIHAHGYSYSSTGPYALSLSAGLPPPTPGPSPTPYDRPIELGQTVEDTLYPRSAGNHYVFQINAPTMVAVALQRRDGGTGLYAELTDFNGYVLQSLSSYDSSGLILAQNVALQVPGTYTIRVYSYDDYPSTYTLTLSPGEALTSYSGQIAYGQSVTGQLVASGQQDEWTFEGRGGDVITIILNGLNLSTRLELRGPNNATLITGGSGSPLARIDGYSLPADGTYTIIAASVGGSYGSYRLSLYRQEETSAGP